MSKVLSVAVAAFAMSLSMPLDAARAATIYVNGTTGNNANTCLQAQNPNTPKKTIGRGILPQNPVEGGIQCAEAGDTVMVAPGTYAEQVESKRDGIGPSPALPQGAPIKIVSATPLAAVIQPPAGLNGFFISHNYHTIDGFTVRQGFKGMQLGPHDAGNGPIVGVLVQNNTITDNTNNGIKVNNGLQVEIALNKIKLNGENGVVYSGNASLIHDNVIRDNGLYGINVKDGVDHQVYDNTFANNTNADLKMDGTTIPTPALTYYVDCANGSDAFTATQAKNPATPWRSVTKALTVADGGDTVLLLGGTEALPTVCAEGVESRVDGAPGKSLVIQASPPLSVVIDPPSGNGIVITHSYYSLVGLVVRGAATGIQLGPHDGRGPVNGLVVNGAHVFGNTSTGIKFSNAVGGNVKHSVVNNNGSHGIFYSGTGGSIFNNVVYRNGGGGDYGVTVSSGSGHLVRNNTISGNVSGGLRLGESSDASVSVTALNNIIANNAIGIKEQGTGVSTLDYNDLFGNLQPHQLIGSVLGLHSIALDPRFVDEPGDDYRLGRVASGQPADSPAIDAGSTTSDAMNLEGRTAFTDKAADAGTVDLGFHGTLLYPAEGTVTVSGANITFNSGLANDGFSLAMKLTPGAGSDGIGVGSEYVEITFGAIVFAMPVSGFQPSGANQWTYRGSPNGQIATGTFVKNGDGSVNLSVTASGLTMAYADAPISLGVRIGDDFGVNPGVSLRGSLSFP